MRYRGLRQPSHGRVVLREPPHVHVLAGSGHFVAERYVERVARAHTISLRTGCVYNRAPARLSPRISRETLVRGEFGDGMTLDDNLHAIGQHPAAPSAPRSDSSPTSRTPTFKTFASELVDPAEVPHDLPPCIGC